MWEGLLGAISNKILLKFKNNKNIVWKFSEEFLEEPSDKFLENSVEDFPEELEE